MPIDAELGMLVMEIEANVSHAETITHGLTNVQFNWRPEPGRWSIAECISHLTIVDGLDVAPIQAAIDKGRAQNRTGEGPFQYGFLSKKFVRMMDLPVKSRMRAPKEYVPPPDSDLTATMRKYRDQSKQMREMAMSANGLHLARVKTEVPLFPALLRALYKMPLGARFALLVAHDRRHLWQAEQVRQHPDFPV